MPESLQLVIGGKEHERVAVELLGREYPEPDSLDADDSNWVPARVSVAAGAFRGQFSCCLRAEDFARLLPQLHRLEADASGSARFTTMEGQLEFEIKGDGRGHFDVRGEAMDEAGIGNKLTWSLTIDQTYLRPIIASVSAISTGRAATPSSFHRLPSTTLCRSGPRFGPSAAANKPQEPVIAAAAITAQRPIRWPGASFLLLELDNAACRRSISRIFLGVAREGRRMVGCSAASSASLGVLFLGTLERIFSGF